MENNHCHLDFCTCGLGLRVHISSTVYVSISVHFTYFSKVIVCSAVTEDVLTVLAAQFYLPPTSVSAAKKACAVSGGWGRSRAGDFGRKGGYLNPLLPLYTFHLLPFTLQWKKRGRGQIRRGQNPACAIVARSTPSVPPCSHSSLPRITPSLTLFTLPCLSPLPPPSYLRWQIFGGAAHCWSTI